MGIHDRDYYRREGKGYIGSMVDVHQVCVWLLAANVVLFVLQMGTGGVYGWFTEGLCLKPDKVVYDGEVWRLVTHAFLHANFMHILFNMLFLWWFGTEVETIYGSREFLAFYLVSVVLGGLAYMLSAATELAGATMHSSALGASGAVTAIMMLFALHYPHRTVLLFFVLPVPVWLLVGFQVVSDLAGITGLHRDNVAFGAHLGGAAFAFVYFKRKWRVLNWVPNFGGRRGPRSTSSRRARPNLHVYREEPPPQPVSVATPPVATAGDVDEHLEAKLDQVLAKVQQHGQASLTESERQILFRASEIYKRRRK